MILCITAPVYGQELGLKYKALYPLNAEPYFRFQPQMGLNFVFGTDKKSTPVFFVYYSTSKYFKPARTIAPA